MSGAAEASPLHRPELEELEATVSRLERKIHGDAAMTRALQQWYGATL